MTDHRKPTPPNHDGSYWVPALLVVLAVIITVWTILGNEGVAALLNLMFN